MLVSLVVLESPAPRPVATNGDTSETRGQVPNPGAGKDAETLALGGGAVILGAYLGPWAVTGLLRSGKGSPPSALPRSKAVASGPGGRASRPFSCLWLQYQFPFLLVTTARSLISVHSSHTLALWL